MKSKLLNLFLLLATIEGLFALVFYLLIPAETETNLLFNQSMPRLLLAGLMMLVILAGAVLWLTRLTKEGFASRVLSSIDEKLGSGPDLLFTISALCLTGFVFSVEAFFLTFVSFPPFVRPITLWATAFFLQARIFLQIRYPKRYESIVKILRRKWAGLTSIQHKTFLVMIILTIVYFCAFIPVNSLGWNKPDEPFTSGVDENIQYPIAVYTLTKGDTFASTVYHVIANEDDVYGHQYVTLESLVLLPSRIILGEDFGSYIQLNLFLLRQFICVLFTSLSIFMMVYMVTKFRNVFVSAGLYVFMLTIPGIILFNTRFLHPDAVVLFLIVLTIYFLQKDYFKFKRNFFFAAITCGLATGIKLWGVFFVFPIALYFALGLIKKRLSFKTAVLLGAGFILVMVTTIVVTNPSMLIPPVFYEWLAGVKGQIFTRTTGYEDPTNSGIYVKDFPTWMQAIERRYMQEYYLFFCFAALAVYSFIGQRKWLAQILLAWCIPMTIFLVYFIAAKSYWWMMELLIPLYPAPFLLFSLTGEKETGLAGKFLTKPKAANLIRAVVILVCGSQFVINLLKLIGL